MSPSDRRRAILAHLTEGLTVNLDRLRASTPARRAAAAELQKVIADPTPKALALCRQHYRARRHPCEVALCQLDQLSQAAAMRLQDLTTPTTTDRSEQTAARLRFGPVIESMTADNAVRTAQIVAGQLHELTSRHVVLQVRDQLSKRLDALGVKDAHARRVLIDLDAQSLVNEVSRLHVLVNQATELVSETYRELRNEDQLVSVSLQVLRESGDLVAAGGHDHA